MRRQLDFTSFFFFNDTATTEIYTLSLHDALPISQEAHPTAWAEGVPVDPADRAARPAASRRLSDRTRSEEHTSELQSPDHLVCRLLLEKKKNINTMLLQPAQKIGWNGGSEMHDPC